MRPRARLAALVAFTLAAVAAGRAGAYCRASTCAEGQLCGPPPWGDPECKPLAWMRPCVGASLQVRGSEQVPLDVAEAVVRQSFLAWAEPSCDAFGGGKPNIHVADTGFVECDLVEYNGKGGNANIIVFRDGVWPHPAGPHNIALTTVTFDTKTGEIYDADMEVNSAGFTLTANDTEIYTDLASVMTHEAGHFLGISHSEVPEATMWANYTPGDVTPRTLDPDDIEAICSTYPPASEPFDTSQCNPIPRHGFSPACLSKQTEGDCSLRAVPREDAKGHAGLMLAAMVVIASARRVKKGRSERRGK
jgi:hypothetical protein